MKQSVTERSATEGFAIRSDLWAGAAKMRASQNAADLQGLVMEAIFHISVVVVARNFASPSDGFRDSIDH